MKVMRPEEIYMLKGSHSAPFSVVEGCYSNGHPELQVGLIRVMACPEQGTCNAPGGGGDPELLPDVRQLAGFLVSGGLLSDCSANWASHFD